MPQIFIATPFKGVDVVGFLAGVDRVVYQAEKYYGFVLVERIEDADAAGVNRDHAAVRSAFQLEFYNQAAAVDDGRGHFQDPSGRLLWKWQGPLLVRAGSGYPKPPLLLG